MTNKLQSLLRCSALAAGLAAAGGASALTLPTVTNCGYGGALSNLLCFTTTSGAEVYIASEHDDFISYSVNAMQQLTNDFGYTELSEWSSLPPFGSGQIVKLFTFNNANNGTFPNATGGTGDHENDPGAGTDQTPKNDGQYLGEWPVLNNVTVGNVLTFLGTGNYSPVFSFDLNNGANLYLTGTLEVRRYTTATEFSTRDAFSFDNFKNNVYDEGVTPGTEAARVLAQKAVEVTSLDPSNAKCPGGVCTMDVDNSVGSGKPDFFAFAPELDLRDYLETDKLYFKLRMWGLDSGGEELALTNAVTPPPPTQVPEPGVLALLGLGLLGLGAAHRKSQR